MIRGVGTQKYEWMFHTTTGGQRSKEFWNVVSFRNNFQHSGAVGQKDETGFLCTMRSNHNIDIGKQWDLFGKGFSFQKVFGYFMVFLGSRSRKMISQLGSDIGNIFQTSCFLAIDNGNSWTVNSLGWTRWCCFRVFQREGRKSTASKVLHDTGRRCLKCSIHGKQQWANGISRNRFVDGIICEGFTIYILWCWWFYHVHSHGW